MLKKLGLGSLALVATLVASVAIAGLWNNFPQVGSARYCITTVNGVCQQYVPAGPSIVTGDYTIPADTNLSGGQNPQTVKLSLMSLNAAPLTFEDITPGSASYTYTLANNSGGIVFESSVTISSVTINAPAAPIDGQQVLIGSNRTITTLAFVANTGQTLSVTTPTVLTASTTAPQGYKFVYRASTAKWTRLQ